MPNFVKKLIKFGNNIIKKPNSDINEPSPKKIDLDIHRDKSDVPFDKPALQPLTQVDHNNIPIPAQESVYDVESSWWVWFGVDLEYYYDLVRDFVFDPKSGPVDPDYIDTTILKKQIKETKYIKELKKTKINRRKLIRTKYNSLISYFSQKEKICKQWFTNTEGYLYERRSEEENLIPKYDHIKEEFEDIPINLVDRASRLKEVCNDLQCYIGDEQNYKSLQSCDISLPSANSENEISLLNHETYEEMVNKIDKTVENRIIEIGSEYNQKLENERTNFIKYKETCKNELANLNNKLISLSNKERLNQNKILDLKINQTTCQDSLNKITNEYNILNEKFLDNEKDIKNYQHNQSLYNTINIMPKKGFIIHSQKFLEYLILLPIKVAKGDAFPEMKTSGWGLNSLSLVVIRLFMAIFIIYIYFIITSSIFTVFDVLVHNSKKDEVTKNILITDTNSNSNEVTRNKVKQNKNIDEETEWENYKNKKLNFIWINFYKLNPYKIF